MLAVGLASVTAGAFVMLGLGVALVVAGLALVALAIVASRAGL